MMPKHTPRIDTRKPAEPVEPALQAVASDLEIHTILCAERHQATIDRLARLEKQLLSTYIAHATIIIMLFALVLQG